MHRTQHKHSTQRLQLFTKAHLNIALKRVMSLQKAGMNVLIRREMEVEKFRENDEGYARPVLR